MLPPFIEYVSGLSASGVRDWLIEGLTSCRRTSGDESPVRPARAFANARLSFGQNGDQRTAVDELKALFDLLPGPAQLSFQKGLAAAIDILSIEPRTMGVFDDLVELALDTRCNQAIDALIGKLKIARDDARRSVFLHVAFFLDESDSPKAVLRLAKAMLNSGQYPDEISARLLVALCRYDVRSAGKYANTLSATLGAQIDFLKAHKTGYQRFRNEFARAVLQAPRRSKTIQTLLAIPLYTKLLDGFIEGHCEPAPRRTNRFAVKSVIRGTQEWAIELRKVCAAAARITCFSGKSRHSDDTLATLQRYIESAPHERRSGAESTHAKVVST
jgi:hypothetical protein